MPLDGQCRLLLGESGNLVAAALKAGSLKLTVPELDDVNSEFGVTLPDKGTGKSGALLKQDKARALVEHVFKDDAEETPESKENMIKHLCNVKSVTMDSETDDLLMQAVAAIDPEEARDFSHVINDCLNRVAARRKQKALLVKEGILADLAKADPAAAAAAASAEPGKSWSHHTPEELRCLLPGKNTLPYVYLRRNPSNDPDKDTGSFTGTYKRKPALTCSTVYSFKQVQYYTTRFRVVLFSIN